MKVNLEMTRMKLVLILGTLAVLLIAGSFAAESLITTAAVTAVVGVMRFLGLLCIIGFGIVRYMLR